MFFKKNKNKKKNRIKPYKISKRDGFSIEEITNLCDRCQKRYNKIFVC